jgi:hypothetical protein
MSQTKRGCAHNIIRVFSTFSSFWINYRENRKKRYPVQWETINEAYSTNLHCSKVKIKINNKMFLNRSGRSRYSCRWTTISFSRYRYHYCCLTVYVTPTITNVAHRRKLRWNFGDWRYISYIPCSCRVAQPLPYTSSSTPDVYCSRHDCNILYLCTVCIIRFIYTINRNYNYF